MPNDAGRLYELEEPVDILIVDDLSDKLLVLQTVLQELGQNLVLARSGTEALREILRREFAVILLDVNMPDIDGLETAGLIRKYKKSAHTPIIFITAHAEEAQILRGYALGAVDYIFSPVIPEVLRGKVKVFVELHRMQRRIRQQAEERIALIQAETARRAADENTRRFDFLARASHELSGSLDRGLTALRLLRLVVPEIAPLAALVLADPDEVGPAMVLRASAAAGGTQVSAGRAVPPALSQALATAMAGEYAVPLSAAMLDPGTAPATDWPRGLQSGLALPLRIGGRCLGALAIATDGAHFNPRDVAMLEELAGRAAISFENARLYSNLQQEIIERQQVELELAEANRRKDEFLAMLSHELRNPLAPIRNAVEVMRRPAADAAALTWARDVVERQVSHLTRLVDELLDVARIAGGKAALRMEPLELSAIITHAVETTQPLIEERRHELVQRIAPQAQHLHGDFTRLVQVIANLLNNAAKYTPDGGRIELVAEPLDQQILISVRDNGAGIDAELLPHVFELFTQGKQPLDRGPGGLGVGLTLVHALVQQHGGRIEAHSGGPGQGAEFRIYLPLAAADGTEAPAADAAAPSPEGARRVLVVDDNQDAAATIAMVLDMEGHEVVVAADGAQALSRIREFAPEVILLDIGLPNVSGYEVAEAVRSDPRLRDALLIALTGYGRPEDLERTSAAGFHHHFVKPVEPQQILDAIAQGAQARHGRA